MADWDIIYKGMNIATMADNGTPYGMIEKGYFALRAGRIAAVGPISELTGEPMEGVTELMVEMPDDIIALPGFVDCHTHMVFGGNRADEFEQRLNGASYADISRAGGGIKATVQATRDLTESELASGAALRLSQMMNEGVTTLEVKSGYGLTLGDEMKMLRAAKALGRSNSIEVVATLLGAHALPSEYANDPDGYIDLVCNEMIPAAVKEDLIQAVDAFCEGIGFTPEQTRKVFEAAKKHGVDVKLHADQLSDLGGAALAAEYGALSADHLEYTNEAGVKAMAKAGTVAVLLPGAFYSLRETKQPPVQALRDAGVPIALATDCNPGSSPVNSILLMLNMGCTLFGLTPEEALKGITINGAKALGLGDDRGTIEPGKRGDVSFFRIRKPAELAWQIGGRHPILVLKDGMPTEPRTVLPPAFEARWEILADNNDMLDLAIIQENGADEEDYTLEIGPKGFPADSAEHFLMPRNEDTLANLASGFEGLLSQTVSERTGKSLDMAEIMDGVSLHFSITALADGTFKISGRARSLEAEVPDSWSGIMAEEIAEDLLTVLHSFLI